MVFGYGNNLNMYSTQTALTGSNPWASVFTSVLGTAQNVAYMSMMPSCCGNSYNKMYMFQSIFSGLSSIGSAVGQSVAQSEANKVDYSAVVQNCNTQISQKAATYNQYVATTLNTDASKIAASDIQTTLKDDFTAKKKTISGMTIGNSEYTNLEKAKAAAYSQYTSLLNQQAKPTTSTGEDNQSQTPTQEQVSAAKTLYDSLNEQYENAQKAEKEAQDALNNTAAELKELIRKRDEAQSVIDNKTLDDGDGNWLQRSKYSDVKKKLEILSSNTSGNTSSDTTNSNATYTESDLRAVLRKYRRATDERDKEKYAKQAWTIHKSLAGKNSSTNTISSSIYKAMRLVPKNDE